MLVRCVVNDIEKFSNLIVRERLAESIHREGADDDLIVNATYTVLAMERWSDGGVRIYLHTVDESEHPYPYPIEMFEVIDSTVTMGWCVVFEQEHVGVSIKRISFPEWANDDSFYEKLIDSDEKAIAVYRQYRKKIKG